MKATFTHNQYYLIETNSTLNRLYITIYGLWPCPENIHGFLMDIEQALNELSSNFTTLIDLSGSKAHPYNVALLHIQAHKLLKEKNILQAAQVYHDRQVGIQAAAAGMISRLPFKQFNNCPEAERCLNRASAHYLLDGAGMFFELVYVVS